MKITTLKDRILNSIIIAERIVGKKESLPVLSCVLMDVNKELLIRSTNLESGIEIKIKSEVFDRGSVAVPASIISQTLRSIRVDKIEIKTEEGNLIIESKRTKTLIKAVPHEEFPTLPQPKDSKNKISVSKTNFLRGIQAVLYAASASMIRPELGSIYISIRDGNLVFAATDSFRLAERIVKSAAERGDGEMLIPVKHASELAYILERIEDEEIGLFADDSQLMVEAGDVRFMSRVVAGTFPNYKEIIPKTFSTEATVLKNDFAETLKKARVFSGGEQNVGMHIYPKKKIFSATAQSPDVGEMSDSIDAAVSGEDIDINFHIGYLADCLASIESDSIVLGFSGAGKPLVIRGVSDAGFTYLVMPLNR